MRKERSYDFKKVDVCRNCQGKGMVPEVTFEPLPAYSRGQAILRTCSPTEMDVRCEVCEGSGRVWKTTHVDIIIEPYMDGSI